MRRPLCSLKAQAGPLGCDIVVLSGLAGGSNGEQFIVACKSEDYRLCFAVPHPIDQRAYLVSAIPGICCSAKDNPSTTGGRVVLIIPSHAG